MVKTRFHKSTTTIRSAINRSTRQIAIASLKFSTIRSTPRPKALNLYRHNSVTNATSNRPVTHHATNIGMRPLAHSPIAGKLRKATETRNPSLTRAKLSSNRRPCFYGFSSLSIVSATQVTASPAALVIQLSSTVRSIPVKSSGLQVPT